VTWASSSPLQRAGGGRMSAVAVRKWPGDTHPILKQVWLSYHWTWPSALFLRSSTVVATATSCHHSYHWSGIHQHPWVQRQKGYVPHLQGTDEEQGRCTPGNDPVPAGTRKNVCQGKQARAQEKSVPLSRARPGRCWSVFPQQSG
jgi:hypothetical protein